jgi:hypothetical protein
MSVDDVRGRRLVARHQAVDLGLRDPMVAAFSAHRADTAVPIHRFNVEYPTPSAPLRPSR